MASLEKKSVRQPGQYISKDSKVYINPYALTPSRSCSITESILRRQLDPTWITKKTIQRQAEYLGRANPTHRGYIEVSSPLGMMATIGKRVYTKAPRPILYHLYATIVEYYPSSTKSFPWRHEILKQKFTTTGANQVQEKAEPQTRKVQIRNSLLTTNHAASGGTVTNNNLTLLSTTTMDG